MSYRRLTGAFVVLLLVFLSGIGCRSSGEVVVAPPEVTIVEDFDPTPYPDPPPVLAGDIVHVLPPQVIGEVAAPARGEATPRSVSGYRIQVGSYRDRTEANQSLQETIEWWNSIQEEAESSTTPIYIEWEQPYWKIRIGNFRTRQEANRMLGDVRREFEGAFVVPSTIEIR